VVRQSQPHHAVADRGAHRSPPAFICTETHERGEEIVASYLYQTFLYDWLDRNGRSLADGDR
jgi:hypothetical protein